MLTRELQSAAAGGRTVRVKDLVHRQTRQVLAVRGAVGLWRDLSLFLSMPIVLADDRWLDFDRRASANATTSPARGPAAPPRPA